MPQHETHAATGWIRDFPDIRDYTLDHEAAKHLIVSTGFRKVHVPDLPSSIDWRAFCSPVEDQQDIGSCTAHAGASLVEYFERRTAGKHIDVSRLFLYKTTRNFLRWTGDTGATLRGPIGAMVLFGVPPEEYWPYDTAKFDHEPSAFCYAFADNYRCIRYIRLDPSGTGSEALLNRIRTNIAAGIPAMFGFTVYSSIRQGSATGMIPFPSPGESVLGGHAVTAVGYDNKRIISNGTAGSPATTGAFLIRNSWGKGWGESGYGWLPYDYVLKGLAVDWWILIKMEWIDTGLFRL